MKRRVSITVAHVRPFFMRLSSFLFISGLHKKQQRMMLKITAITVGVTTDAKAFAEKSAIFAFQSTLAQLDEPKEPE
eukprot:CAMPEP_0197635834 /NCGR_PEP_ID=MMETSP1338-20131121/11538_1 /TAXON_ID=43686 ORGANISM="Pelagodinium beii, Strain RCC1491" /NCGR_SAMPLE_ID=MMETSP1338 /ASSEMBLY_ACC=CAM_ASM_000754 /LENGTH=76 /DNA_ID=CAMNT_0043207959 /DNA_START=457 /DNA_END=687 /DNA_ORIENTATION=+